MRRIGIVGIENSHVDHFVRHLNVETRHPGNRVVALVGEDDERAGELRATGAVDQLVGHPRDLIGRVDAAIVASRDGRAHREQAVPLLDAGVPVLVDKPLATTTADARAMVAAAERGGVPLLSYSAVRFAPAVSQLTAPERGAPRHVVVTGPADPDSEYAGLFFYGIHHVETALELLGDAVTEPPDWDVSVTRLDDTVVASTTVGTTVVTLVFAVPQGEHRVPFHVQVTRDDAVDARVVELGPDYTAPMLARFVETCDKGIASVSPPALLTPVAVLEGINEALEARRGRNA